MGRGEEGDLESRGLLKKHGRRVYILLYGRIGQIIVNIK